MPARSILERDLTASACVDVWAQSQYKSGVTLCSRPKDVYLEEIRFQGLIGGNTGELNNRCTSAIGAIVVLSIANVLGTVVASISLSVTGPVAARAASSSTMVGVATSCTMIHYCLTYPVVGKLTMRKS